MKSSLSLALVLALGLSACGKAQFSPLITAPVPPPEQGSSEPPPVVQPDRGPQIVWEKVPQGSLGTFDSVEAIYKVIPGTSPLKSIECLVNEQPVACELEGQTLQLRSEVAGEHYLQIRVVDVKNLSDSDAITWNLFEKFQKISSPLVVEKEDAQADILFVIDNSRSMREEQANMAQRIDSFMDRLGGLDWRIGIVTTDVTDVPKGDGRFLKFPNNNYSIDSSLSLATARSQFGRTIQTGIDGNHIEQGIYATYRAIERAVSPRDSLDRIQQNFFRAKSALSVVVISDENESGIGPRNQPENLIRLVQDTWGADKLFKFHSIVVRPGDATCLNKLDHSTGTTYARLTQMTGGILGDICAADYGNQLTVIGQDVQNLQNTYSLACEPKDVNGDGAPDVRVFATGSVTVPSFIIEGKKIVFSKPPKVGSYTLDYYCPKE